MRYTLCDNLSTGVSAGCAATGSRIRGMVKAAQPADTLKILASREAARIQKPCRVMSKAVRNQKKRHLITHYGHKRARSFSGSGRAGGS